MKANMKSKHTQRFILKYSNQDTIAIINIHKKEN